MTHPLTNALAMRTAAARTAEYLRDVSGRNQDGDFYVGEEAACFAGSVADEIVSEILALPLEADRAALLAEAVRMPEIAALIEKSDRIANWQIGGLLADHPENREKYPLLSEAIVNLRSALSALETP